MGVSRAYLDTYYLLEVVMKRRNKRTVEHLLSRIKSPSFKIMVPQIVLGEATAKIFSMCSENNESPCMLVEKVADLLQKYQINVKNCLPPPRKEAFAIMAELADRDEMLDATDIMILAYALADPDSKFLFTTDTKMLRNARIKEYDRYLRDDKRRNTTLIITNYV